MTNIELEQVQSSSSSEVISRISSFAVSVACLLILKHSVCWLPGISCKGVSSVATGPLISSGQTKLSGLSMWWPLCSKITPLMTPSLPWTWRIILPFFHFAWFFSSPTTSTISPMSGTRLVFLLTQWLSNKLCMYLCFHLFHTCCLASFSRLWSVSVFFCLLYLVCVLPPHQLIRVKTCSFPPSLSRYVKGWLFICLFMSTITISSCSKLRVQGAKKIIFTACHSGKLKLAFTSPDIISTSPKNLLFFCYSNSS